MAIVSAARWATTLPTARSAMALTFDQVSTDLPHSSHILNVGDCSGSGSDDDGSSLEVGASANGSGSRSPSILPPTAPTPIRIVSSLISLLRSTRHIRSCERLRIVGTSTDTRKNRELSGPSSRLELRVWIAGERAGGIAGGITPGNPIVGPPTITIPGLSSSKASGSDVGASRGKSSWNAWSSFSHLRSRSRNRLSRAFSESSSSL